VDRARVLIVDDESTLRFAIRDYLESAGFEIHEAEDIASARRAVAEAAPDIVLLDYKLPDGTSAELIPDMKAFAPDLPIIMLTGHATIELAVEAMKLGADQFLTKPVQLSALRIVIDRMLANRRSARRDAAHTRQSLSVPNPFLGTSRAIGTLRNQAQRVVASDRPVLIQGETGSGKGVLANWLHANGPRAAEPFVDLNCAGLTRELLESELFGHEKGAFTGAVAAKPGLLEIADGGSVFLDEIGDMDLPLQAKLLKVVEEKRYRRVGDVRDRKVDMRLIAATHRDLAVMARDQTFRSDLYFRISTIRLVVPPLRERLEDIPILAEVFLRGLAREVGRPGMLLTRDAVAALQRYHWPGNVRELRNVIERAVLLHDGVGITAQALHFDVDGEQPARSGVMTLAEVEKAHILDVLERENGHVERAAERLGIPRSSLYQKLKKIRDE